MKKRGVAGAHLARTIEDGRGSGDDTDKVPSEPETTTTDEDYGRTGR